VNAVDIANAARHAARILFAHSATDAADIGSNIIQGTVSITLDVLGNIQINDGTNGNGSFDWLITYVPLP
jgi:hypothetical protein